ncbi:hypothetical protein GCM10020219_007720 [Nonomuraea dietziae]
MIAAISARGLFDGARVVRGAVRDPQVDHVLPVVGARLEDLPGLEGRVHRQVRQRLPVARRVLHEGAQEWQLLVPALQEHQRGQRGFAQCRAQVEHSAVRRHQAREPGPARSRKGADGERAGEGN